MVPMAAVPLGSAGRHGYRDTTWPVMRRPALSSLRRCGRLPHRRGALGGRCAWASPFCSAGRPMPVAGDKKGHQTRRRPAALSVRPADPWGWRIGADRTV